MATPIDVLDPNAPKKKPAVAGLDTGVPAPLSGAAAPSAVDTGIPAPTAAPVSAPDRVAATGVETATPAAAPTPAPAPAPTGVTQQAGIAQVNQAMLARVGHALTPEETQGLAQAVGAPANPDGTYSQAQINQALDLVSRYSGNLATPWGELPESAPGSTTSLANRRLTELLGQKWGEVDPNSQAIQQPMGAFRAANQRATDRARLAMSLRNQNEGITGGGEDVGLLGLLEDQGVKEGSYEANLYANELATQRTALQNAIQLATQAGLQNKARQLQEELAKLDLALRQKLGEGQLALGARSLDQNDRQFLDSLGFNYASLQGSLNNQAINALLGA
jgi:hypothetical protein